MAVHVSAYSRTTPLIVPNRQEEERIRPKVCGDFFQAKKKTRHRELG